VLLAANADATVSGFVPAPVKSALPSTCATNRALPLTRQLALNVPFEVTGTVFDAQRPFESIETTTCSPPVADARSPRTITVPTRARTRPRVVRFSPRAKPASPPVRVA
jgi:hypothetical protein